MLLRCLLFGCLSFGAFLAPGAQACPTPLPAVDGPDFFQFYDGATNSNASLGSGGLTATISRCGEITSLRWPGPGSPDQLAYLTSSERTAPHMGALDGMGAFVGLAYDTLEGKGFTWLRDAPWTHVQRYATDDAAVLVTEMTNAALGLTVEMTTFVLPDRDVLVLHHKVIRRRGSPIRSASLMFYENLSPTLTRVPYFPVGDWLLDFQNDHAVVYDRHARALVHYLPERARDGVRDFGPLVPALQSESPAEAASVVRRVLHGADEPGVYIALGAAPRDNGFQAGFDDAALCTHQSAIAHRAIDGFFLPPALDASLRAQWVCDRAVTDPDGPLGACRAAGGWRYRAESAFSDVQDGVLSGSPIAACQANGALARRLRFRGNHATATFYVTAATTRRGAVAALRSARRDRPRAQQRVTERWWRRLLRHAKLPATDDPAVVAFARRSLAVIRTATDNASGAIVASVAAQAPYGADWPRDGAFINYALDLAGMTDVVTRHNRLYARLQRRDPIGWSPAFSFPACDPTQPTYPACIPAGTFEMSYYPDAQQALPAWPVSFEIDQAALAVWTWWRHATVLADPAAYLADVCPAIVRGADAVAGCRDPITGLQCAANEDDSFTLTQGLQGAGTVLLALRSAIAASPACAVPALQVQAWRDRATELEAVTLATFYTTDPPAHFDGPRPGWVLWPMELLPPGDVRAANHAAYLGDLLTPLRTRTATWTAYASEAVLARAQYYRSLNDPIGIGVVQDDVRFLVHTLATPDTGLLGESAGRVSHVDGANGGEPIYVPLNDVPHTWAHAYLYAAAMVAFGSR